MLGHKQRWEVSSSEEEEESEAEFPDTPPESPGSEPRGAEERRGEAAGPDKMTKFECPSEFTPCPRATSCDLTPEKVNSPSTELWLIKAPADFDPRGFSGRKIPLVGFQTLKSKTCGDKLYNVFGTSSGMGGISLVLPSQMAGHAESCPAFAGCITIGESWEDTDGTNEPRSIPASPVPSIPPGLKLRFQPFGTAPPRQLPRKRRRAQNIVGMVSATPELGDTREPRTKRRKGMKKKTVVSGQEPNEATDREALGVTRRKKKKRKEQEETGMSEPKHGKRRKDEYREIPQTGPCVVDLGHKKKKKKKDKH
ncbi:CD3e molecule, epsilon associated protein [Heterodontus francisci]|uniref:CD3e molecule, epsilon associated protein n=1 Tax=Heterodontus francisci TaxID=7792 RepID=UPI00355B244B